jgi:potassium-dependent mechanosensitive channel
VGAAPRRIAAFLLAAFLGRGCAGLLVAADPVAPATSAPVEASPSVEPASPADAIREQRRQVAAEIAAVQERLAAGAAPESSVTATTQLELLERIDRALAQQLAATERREELGAARSALDGRLTSGPDDEIASPPPYPLGLLDAVSDALEAQTRRTQTLHSALEVAEQGLAKADETLERREQKRRLAREAAETATDPVEQLRLRASLEVARLESRAAQAARDLAALERDNLRAELALQERSERLLSDTQAFVREKLQVEPDGLRASLSRLDEREAALTRDLEHANRQLERAEGKLALAERRLNESSEPDGEQVAEVDARRLERQLWNRRVAFVGDALSRIASERELWKRRYRNLERDVEAPELHTWEQEIRQLLEESERAQRLTEARMAELQQELTASRSQLANVPEGQDPWQRERVDGLQALAELYQKQAADLAADRHLAERTLGEIVSRSGRATFGERIRVWASSAADLWRFELFAVDDRPITIGKVLTALLLFFLGFAVASGASRTLGHSVLRRLSLDPGAASAIQGLVFYLLLLIFFLTALRTVNIPLTAFTVLGGALAIGVGFGSQAVVNNFISGLILMAERPIKVGDLVEVDGTQGVVERIGTRSTRVRTFDNIHIIVPNSAFLENSVINWTLSDEDVRTHVDVGVVYGSPTRDVDRLIRRVLEEHGRILREPPPSVWFTDFGDNALQFRANFWIRSRDMGERKRIESDVRHRIDHLFREARITIAFPQRDVHLDSTRPIEVRVVESEPSDET